MLDKEFLKKARTYGILTKLDNDNIENFFNGFQFYYNFDIIYQFIELLNQNNIEYTFVSCFDYQSEDVYINSFSYLSLSYSDELLDFITNKIEFEYDISISTDNDGILEIYFENEEKEEIYNE